MALHDGFFDATITETLEDGTEIYDREYDAGDFTDYLGQIIGSGVCVYENPDSFLVRFENGSAVVAPGYLFIRGYWLKNTEDYPITLETGKGNYVIIARLNMSERKIELLAVSPETPLTDALILALINPNDGWRLDLRGDENYCGTIDAVGSLSEKVKWAVNYIDTQVEAKLEEAEAAVKEQTDALDAKIAEVTALAEELSPPPIGTIKFSASQTMDPEWLLCDGSFISKANYPELVELLGNYYPSGDKSQLLSSGEVGAGITNGALYGGRMWFYSYAQKKLYGVDVAGTSPIKSISVSSSNAKFGNFQVPSIAKPLVLSIVPHLSGTGAKLFLSQIIGGTVYSSAEDYEWMEHFLLFGCNFTGSESSLSVSPPFTKFKTQSEEVTTSSGTNSYIVYLSFNANSYVPYVVSYLKDGKEIYHCLTGLRNYKNGTATTSGPQWEDGATEAEIEKTNMGTSSFAASSTFYYTRKSYSRKNQGDFAEIYISGGATPNGYSLESYPSENFTWSGRISPSSLVLNQVRKSYGPLPIFGGSRITDAFDISAFPCLPNGKNMTIATTDLTLPSSARLFLDAGAYLWGKDIFMIFVGTGIIFSRTLEAGSFGYLDTTGVLGVITQFGYLDYSEDEGTLYIAGQDSANKVKVAKMELDTLFDYASDGAWLPSMNMDGIPAYIKAKEPEAET